MAAEGKATIVEPWVFPFLFFGLQAVAPAYNHLILAADMKPPPSVEAFNQASNTFYRDLRNQSQTLQEAIERYHQRYLGRPPPFGFDIWFEWATNRSCIIDQYDWIDQDMRPFYDYAKLRNVTPARTESVISPRSWERAPYSAASIQRLIGAQRFYIGHGETRNPTAAWYGHTLLEHLSGFAQYWPESIGLLEFAQNPLDEPRLAVNQRDALASQVTPDGGKGNALHRLNH